MEVFNYHKLLRGEARIAVLHPSSSYTAELVCTLVHIRLQDVGTVAEGHYHYDALSYTWGGPGKRFKMRVNHGALVDGVPSIDDSKAPGELSLTTNLAYALRNLRQNDRFIRLWVDQICINQEDVSERNEQVSQIFNIFSKASKTWIWLGLADSYIKGAFKDIIDAENAELDHLSDRDFTYLLGNTWFVRAWVFQEAVASNEVVLYSGAGSGQIQVPWSSFKNKCQAYYNRNRRVNTPSKGQTGYALERVFKIQRARNLYADLNPQKQGSAAHSSNSLSLLSLLDIIRLAKATDPRDKVYSILSLASKKVDDLLSINYNKSLAQVYTETAIALFNNGASDSLDFLSYVEPRHEREGWPSWVPDWSVCDPKSQNSLWRYDFRRLSQMDGACGSTKVSASISSSVLSSRGVEIGRIESTTTEETHDSIFVTLSIESENAHYIKLFANGAYGKILNHKVPQPLETKDVKDWMAKLKDCEDWNLIGAIVCIFHGCKLPLILKKKENGRYCFLGACFAGGVMNGDFMNDVGPSQVVTYEIE
jgi:hypothetical protein